MTYHQPWMRWSGLFLFWGTWLAALGLGALRMRTLAWRLYLAGLFLAAGTGLWLMGHEGSEFNRQAPQLSTAGRVDWTDDSPRSGRLELDVVAPGGAGQRFTLYGTPKGRVVEGDQVQLQYQDESEDVLQLRVVAGRHPGWTYTGVHDEGWMHFMTGMGEILIALAVGYGAISAVRSATAGRTAAGVGRG